METYIMLAGLTKESTVDGPGIRIALYLQGCPHHCSGCHNPETWNIDNGVSKTVNETLKLITDNLTPLHQGITISGGEPFMQPAALLALVQGIRERFHQLNIWCYTGYLYDDLIQSPILPYLDILVDGPYQESERELDLRFKGSRNQRIINVQASISQGQIIEDVRYV